MLGFPQNHSSKKLVCLGDSHLDALKVAEEKGLLSFDECFFHIVPGATAVGLRNPNSLTDALTLFKTTLAQQPIDSVVLIQLGEVDCGFVIWFRSEKYGESIELQLQASLDAYETFLNYVLCCGYTHVCVTGASLPTIREGIDWGEVSNARSSVTASLRERTDITLAYNKRLALLAKSKGVHYFDITDSVLDIRTLTVNDYFRHKTSSDHHLDSEKTAPLWAVKLNLYAGSLVNEKASPLQRYRLERL